MKRRESEGTLDDRAKGLLDEFFYGRGRFSELEKQSGIPLNRWKNFVYGKQRASQEMIDFLCKTHPEESDWLLTGIEHPDQETFPFSAAVPKKWEGQTIGDRLTWVIKEWAAPRGADLFRYLEEKSHGKIPEDAWAQVLLGVQQPTFDMVELVANYRPQFLEWVIRGRVSGEFQVNPTESRSIEEWKALNKARREQQNEAMRKMLDKRISTTKHDDQSS